MVKIAIDAGHGINTAGKRTPDDEREWTFNNTVALASLQELASYENVEIVRLDDPTGKQDIPLADRTALAIKEGVDAVVSIHHNANTGQWGDWGGTETYTHNTDTPEADRLAKEVHERMVKAYGLRDRGLKTANFHMLRVPENSGITAILTEGGFMDSRTDISALRSDSTLRKAGVAIAEGIASFFNLKRKSTASNSNDGLIRVQVGAFNKKGNADNFAKKVKKDGFDTFVTKEGGLYKVQLGAYSEQSNANRVADKAKSKGYDVYVVGGSNAPQNASNSSTKQPTPKPSRKFPLPDGVLRQGDRGEGVRQVQTALDAVNFRLGAIDGIYGAKTTDAVRRFQSVYIPDGQDGVYGPRTKKALERQLKNRNLI